MVTVAEQRAAGKAVRATVIDHDPHWKRPVVPVFTGVTAWAMVEDTNFTKWYARPGVVVLGMWEGDEEQYGGESNEPRLEVVLSLDTHVGLLLDLLAFGGGTLAVLQFYDGEGDEPPEWNSCELGIKGLAEAIREAGVRQSVLWP